MNKRKFIIRLFIFLFPIMLLIGCMEYILSLYPNHYKTVKKQLESNMESTEILVLGSSQSYEGINTKYFTAPAFNLAFHSQSIYYDKRMALKYVPKMPKLKKVIISVSYFSLYYQIYGSIESWRDYYYWRFWNIKYPKVPLFTLNRFSLYALYGRAKTAEIIKKYFLHKSGPNPTVVTEEKDKGNQSVIITDSLAEQRVRLHDSFIHLNNAETQEIIAQNISDLEELIVELKKRNIEPVIITTPLTQAYNKYCNKQIEATTTHYINNLCNKYNCRYLDYSHNPSFTDNYFKDADHLNASGAIYFTKILDADLKHNNTNSLKP